MFFFDVKFQPYRPQNSFSDYNDPLNNSDFIKDLRGSELRASSDRNEKWKDGRKRINGRMAVYVIIIKMENYET